MNITPTAAPQSPHSEDTITQLDPALIQLPQHPNRDETFFKSPAYFALRSAILTTRGNTVPVRVHPIAGEPPYTFAADYGICRIRCCLELGLKVTAIVSSTELSDQKRLFQRVQENSCRSDFSPVDLGRIYLDALERKLVTNQAEFAVECGRDPALLSKAIKLASLPRSVLDLFDQIQDVQYRYYKPLWDAYTGANKDHFLHATEVADQLPRPRSPDEIVAILTGKAGQQKLAEPVAIEPFKPAIETSLNWKGKPAGKVTLMEDGGVEITLDRKLEPEKYEELAASIQAFLDRSCGKRPKTKVGKPKKAPVRARGRKASEQGEATVEAADPQLNLDLNLDLSALETTAIDIASNGVQA
jgi:ParB family chromosome partitioning protein